MGTNFYVDAEPTCNNPAHNQQLHIGKSSGGWKFGFHGIPDRGLTSWSAWRDFLADKTIVDEYGTELTLSEFTERVENRWTPAGLGRLLCRVEPTADEIQRGFGGRFTPDNANYHDSEGYDFSDWEFC